MPPCYLQFWMDAAWQLNSHVFLMSLEAILRWMVGKRVGEATGPVIEVWGDQEGWAMPFTFTADLHGPHQLPHAHYFLRFLQVQAAPEVPEERVGAGDVSG